MNNATEPHPQGIYPGILNSEYHAETPPYSSTLIKKMDVPAVAKYALENPQPYKEVFRLGGAIHKFVLEREDFEAEYLVGIDCARRSNANKDEWALWFTEYGADGFSIITHPAAEWNGLFEADTGKNMVKPEEIAAIAMMSDSVMANPNARRLLEGGQAESSVYWTDPETELPLKCRPDYLSAFCSDLKSCRSARKREFANAIVEHGYHISAAMYQEGLLEVTGEIHPFVFIAIEKTPPYLCAIRKTNEVGEQLGRDLFRHYVRKLANCLHNGKWPGLEDDLNLELPPWAFNVDTEQYLQQMEGVVRTYAPPPATLGQNVERHPTQSTMSDNDDL